MTIKQNTTSLNEVLQLVNSLPSGLDTSDGTAIAEDIVVDKTAYVNGEKIVGTNPYEKASTDTKIDTQTDLISQIKTALEGKGSGGGSNTVLVTVNINGTTKYSEQHNVGEWFEYGSTESPVGDVLIFGASTDTMPTHVVGSTGNVMDIPTYSKRTTEDYWFDYAVTGNMECFGCIVPATDVVVDITLD